ncbi:MAG TPA: response regulator [Chitinophagaceae bacterium]
MLLESGSKTKVSMKMEYKIKHIVMCEDDMDQAFLFETYLKKAYPGIKLTVINNGDDLLPYLHNNKADLVFLDLHMPCKNGFECLEMIKNDPILKDIPVIMYSSSAHLNDIHKAFVHHADFYMVKPFTTGHLKTALEKILSVNWKQDPPIRNHYFINNRFVPYTSVA